MADKVEITDVSKLRPELLEKSVKELERMKTEIEMAITQKAEAEKAAERALLVEEANERIERIIKNLQWLRDYNLLPEPVALFFTTSSEKSPTFAPHLKLRKLKA